MPGVSLERKRPPLAYDPSAYLMGLVPTPPWLRYKKQQFYAYPFESNINTPINQQPQVTMEGDSFFMLEAINVVAADPTSVTINNLKISFADTSRGLNWMPNLVDIGNATGRGDGTKYLSHPSFFKPLSTILFSLNSNPTTTPVYGALIGRKIFGLTKQEADFLMRRTWIQYDVLVGPLTALASGNAMNSYPVQIANDSDFYLWKIYSTEAIQYSNTNKPILASIRDVTTNKNIISQAAHVFLIAGQSYPLAANTPTVGITGDGFTLPIPRLIKRNSTVLIDILNTDTNTSNTFGPANFTLEGVRVFDS